MPDWFNAPITGALPISTPGRGFMVNASAGGDIVIVFLDGSTMTMPIGAGHSFFPYAVRAVAPAPSNGAVIASAFGAK